MCLPDSRILSRGKSMKMPLQNPSIHGDEREKHGQALQFRGIVNDFLSFFFFAFYFYGCATILFVQLKTLKSKPSS